MTMTVSQLEQIRAHQAWERQNVASLMATLLPFMCPTLGPMTILAAMTVGDDIVVAADTLETRASTYHLAGTDILAGSASKVAKVTRSPRLVWGFAGSVDNVGDPFGRWLVKQEFSEWAAVRSETQKRLRSDIKEQNENHRDLTGRDDDATLQTQVLICGHLDGPGILRLNHLAGVCFREQVDAPIFVGSGEMAFLIAWHMVDAHAVDVRSPEGLRSFMEIASGFVWGTRRPIDLWRLSPDADPVPIERPSAP